MKTVIVTGAGGFIGSALCRHLLTQKYNVIALQRAQVNLANTTALNAFFKQHQPHIVIHLASQASSTGGDLGGYLQSNVANHNNVLEAARLAGTVEHFLYASSYGIYGKNNQAPFTEDQPIAPPTSIYAATKYANEVITQAWASQSNITCTALRLFNVYGPQGRPDTMTPFFASKLIKGEAIPLHAEGKLVRDFVYIDDVTAAIASLLKNPQPGHTIYNIGSGTDTTTLDFLNQLAQALGRTPVINLQPAAAHEVMQAYANITALKTHTGWQPAMPLKQGLQHFADWFNQQQGQH